MPDKQLPLHKRSLIKGALKSPPIRVNPPSYTEQPRPKSEVTIMKQDWQSDPSSEAALDFLILAKSTSRRRYFAFSSREQSDTDTSLADKVYRTTICSTSVPQPFVDPPSELGR